MFKLVRDNIPEIISKQNQVCNFAQIQNRELLVAFLRDKLIEEVNEFLTSKMLSDESLQELIDIVTVIRRLYKEAGLDDEAFKTLYTEKLKYAGGFDKGYILFLSDPVKEKDENKDDNQ